MSLITICDGGCGKQSPDFNHGRAGMGPHVANGWTYVPTLLPEDRNHIGVRWAQHPSKGYIFCEDCWARVKTALEPAP